MKLKPKTSAENKSKEGQLVPEDDEQENEVDSVSNDDCNQATKHRNKSFASYTALQKALNFVGNIKRA